MFYHNEGNNYNLRTSEKTILLFFSLFFFVAAYGENLANAKTNRRPTWLHPPTSCLTFSTILPTRFPPYVYVVKTWWRSSLRWLTRNTNAALRPMCFYRSLHDFPCTIEAVRCSGYAERTSALLWYRQCDLPVQTWISQVTSGAIFRSVYRRTW